MEVGTKMNYGKSAYTKVLELEKRINSSSESGLFRIYDSGEKSDLTFQNQKVVEFDKLVANKNKKMQFQVSFGITSVSNQTVYLSCEVDGELLVKREIELVAGQEINQTLDFTYEKNSSGVVNGKLVFTSNSDNSILIKRFRVIVLNATAESKKQEISGVELRSLKTPDDTYIVSYTGDDNVVYACEISSDDCELEFFKILNGISHSFAFDKSGQLHLYYVNENHELFDKVLGSSFNDQKLSDDVEQVYAIGTSKYNQSEIVVTMISTNRSKIKYFTKEYFGYSEIMDLGVPSKYYYNDLCMAVTDKFVYVVATTTTGLNFILKSGYEPIASSCFEEVNIEMDLTVEKYYTIGEYSSELMDQITASISMTADVVLNFEKLIDKQNTAVVSARVGIETKTYELPKEEPIVYSVVIDKAVTNYEDRCTYADDALDFTPASNSGSVYVSNGWEERFPFNKIKPCVLRGGKFVGYLNPNDYSLYEDGSAVNSDGENEFVDVMIELPKIYYRVESDDSTVKISISNMQIDESFKCYAHVYDGEELNKIYIGVYDSGYKMYNGKNTMFSYTNTLPNCQDIVSNLEYETLLENKEERYRMLNYDQTVLLQCLFVLMFKSTGSEWSFSKGNKKRLGSININGLCDQKGMYYGSISTETESCKLFGIENLFGNIYTRVEGVAIHGMNDSGTYEFRRRNPYSKVPLNNLGEGYDVYLNPDLDGYYKTEFYLSNPYATTELGFLPKSYRYDDAVSATYNKYYCDTVFIRSSYGLWFGGDYKAYSYGGMFHYYHDLGSEITNKNLGYRLVYYPNGGA